MSGLVNLGNTCYINSVLQILHALDELNDYIHTGQPKNLDDAIFPMEWNDLRQIMDKKVTISPKLFIHKNKILFEKKHRTEFLHHAQGDASEYFMFALECIHNSYNLNDVNPAKAVKDYEKKEYSIVTRLFLSMLEVSYADKVKVVSTNHEAQWAMDLPLPDQSALSLYDCLDAYFKEEYLNGDNRWYDEKEDVKKEVTRRSVLVHCPVILVLNLKRWLGFTKKNNSLVSLRPYLDMSNYASEKVGYELFGIINHIGTLRGGHYYVCIKKKQSWYSINDEHITPIAFDRVVCPNNYCLFYRKLK